MGGVLLGAALLSACWLLAGVRAGLRLFDDERASPLYCAAPPDRLLEYGPTAVRTPAPGSSASAACLPRRLDYAAPGERWGAPPEALCALLRWTALPPALAGERPCS